MPVSTRPISVADPERTDALTALVEVCQRLRQRRHTFPQAFGVPLWREFCAALERAEWELGARMEAATDDMQG